MRLCVASDCRIKWHVSLSCINITLLCCDINKEAPDIKANAGLNSSCYWCTEYSVLLTTFFAVCECRGWWKEAWHAAWTSIHTRSNTLSIRQLYLVCHTNIVKILTCMHLWRICSTCITRAPLRIQTIVVVTLACTHYDEYLNVKCESRRESELHHNIWSVSGETRSLDYDQYREIRLMHVRRRSS